MGESEIPTPRKTGQHDRAAAFRDRVRDLMEKLEHEALKHEKVLGTNFNLKRARKMRILWKKGAALLPKFNDWLHPNSEYQQRMMDIADYDEWLEDIKKSGVLIW